MRLRSSRQSVAPGEAQPSLEKEFKIEYEPAKLATANAEFLSPASRALDSFGNVFPGLRSLRSLTRG